MKTNVKEEIIYGSVPNPTTITTTTIIKSNEDNASSISRFFLTFLNPLFKTGSQRLLNHEDLGVVSEQDKCLKLYETFLNHWNEEVKLPPEKRSLWLVLWRTTTWSRMLLSILLYAIGTGINYGPILILNQLVLYFQSPSTSNITTAQLWIFVALMFVFPMSSSLFLAQSNVIVAHIGIQFRNCLVNMIYRKALRLSPAARQLQSTGMIVNMFSNDTKQLQMFLYFFNNIVIAPFQIVACIVLIYMQVGPSTFVGIGLMLLSLPMNVFVFLQLNKVRQKKVKKTDTRVKLMNEILAGIRVIKYYAWEHAFQKSITAVRLEELLLLKEMAYIVAFGFTAILFLLPLVQPILIFYTYVKLGNQLTSATAFTTIAYFNMLQFPFAFLPMGFSQYSQSLVSTKRMLNFFVSEELDPYVTSNDEKNNIAIKAENMCICWIKEDSVIDNNDDNTIKEKKSDTAVDTKQLASSTMQISDNTTNNNNNNNNIEKSSTQDTYNEEKDIEKIIINIDNNTNTTNTAATTTGATSSDTTGMSSSQITYQPLKTGEESVESSSNTGTNTGNASTQVPVAVEVEQSETPSPSSKSFNNRSLHTLKDINITIEKGSLVAVVGM